MSPVASVAALRQEIDGYVTGQTGQSELRAWLASRQLAIAGPPTTEFDRLAGRVWHVLSAFDQGTLTEADTRDALAAVARVDPAVSSDLDLESAAPVGSAGHS